MSDLRPPRHKRTFASDYLTGISDTIYSYFREMGLNARLTSVKMVLITMLFGFISVVLVASATIITAVTRK